MKIDIARALNYEEYTRNILIGKYEYDDILFLLSVFRYIKVEKVSLEKINTLLSIVSIEHCLNWDEIVDDFCDILEINVPNDYLETSSQSREYVFKTITPMFLDEYFNEEGIKNSTKSEAEFVLYALDFIQ